MLSAHKFSNVFLLASLVSVFLIGCRQSQNAKPDDKPAVLDSSAVRINNTVFAKTKASEQYSEIYAFVKALIKEKQLDTTHGLFLEPALACDLSQHDIAFLKTILVKKKEKPKPPVPISDTSVQTESNLQINVSKWQLSEPPPISISTEPVPCLTKKDINYMLANKPDPLTFRWDNEELGFDTSNHQSFYSLSIPLFSADHKTAIIMIEDLCPGLCGTGNTYIYKKKSDRWKTETGTFGWIH